MKIECPYTKKICTVPNHARALDCVPCMLAKNTEALQLILSAIMDKKIDALEDEAYEYNEYQKAHNEEIARLRMENELTDWRNAKLRGEYDE